MSVNHSGFVKRAVLRLAPLGHVVFFLSFFEGFFLYFMALLIRETQKREEMQEAQQDTWHTCMLKGNAAGVVPGAWVI